MAIVHTGAIARRRRGIGPLLWGVAGVFLFVLTLVVTAENQGIWAFILLIALLGSLVVVLRPELGVLVLTATFLTGYLSLLEGDGGRFTLNNLLGLLLLGVLLARIYSERDASVLGDRHLLMVGIIGVLFLVNQILTASFTPPTELAAHDLSELRVGGFLSKIAYLLFVIAFIRGRTQLLWLTFTVVALILITAPNAILNALAASHRDVERVRAAADFGITAASNANRLAFLCAVGVAIVALAIRDTRAWVLRLVGGLSIALLVAGILLSASRSGLLNLILLGLVFVKKSRPRLFAVLVVVAVLVGVTSMMSHPQGPAQGVLDPLGAARERAIELGSAFVPERYLSRMTSSGVSSSEMGHASTAARLGLLQLGWQAFLENPLVGIGVGNFRWAAVTQYQAPRISALHNSYLLVLVEGGLLLFIPYIALWVYVARSLARSRRLARTYPDVRLGWMVEATQIILFLFLVFSIFADLWHDFYPFIIVGFTAVLAGIYRRRQAAVSAPGIAT